MRFLGFEITRARDVATIERQANYMQSIEGSRGWFSVGLVRDWFPGAWQRNMEQACTHGPHYADFACKTLISQDFSKLRCRVIEQQGDIWVEVTNPAYDPVLRKPNHFQNPIQFWESWIGSKLSGGNTYVLLQRDARRVVNAMYVLDYTRCHPMVAPDGSVFYTLDADNVSGIEAQITVPARDIIHDRMNCLFHPLCGLPPIFASGLAQQQGLNIQHQSVRLYENNASPGGALTAPGTVPQNEIDRIEAAWDQKYRGPQNAGKIAILGNGLKFEKFAMSAAENQMIEQLKWTAEVVCSTYHVPPYKIGVGVLPSYNNVQALNVEYYQQCLQYHIESAERCLEDGLGMANDLGVEFDLEGLLRMDSSARITMLREGVQGGILSPNEARATMGYGPVAGGNSPMTQQQNYSLAALAKRDAKDDPFAKSPGNGSGSNSPADAGQADQTGDVTQLAAASQIAAWKLKALLEAHRAQGV